LIAEEKLIHVETQASYQQVALSEFCITPSEDQTFKFDVKFFFYDIVIGGNGNRVAILRRWSPGILGKKQYVFKGLYKTSISVLFPEIGH
jgi:hypothetical protein